MKLKMNLLMIALIFTFESFGQITNKSTKKPSKTETELMQLERDIGEANIKRDKAFFARIEADECIFTDSGGGLTTKAEDLASLDEPAGETKLISYIVDEMKEGFRVDGVVGHQAGQGRAMFVEIALLQLARLEGMEAEAALDELADAPIHLVEQVAARRI